MLLIFQKFTSIWSIVLEWDDIGTHTLTLTNINYHPESPPFDTFMVMQNKKHKVGKIIKQKVKLYTNNKKLYKICLITKHI